MKPKLPDPKNPEPSSALINQKSEILSPGCPSKRLAEALKEAGKKVSDAQLAEVYSFVEESRKKFCAQAILAGVLFLMKKESLHHGEFKPFILSLKSATRCAFDERAFRTVQIYMFLARRFLANLEQGLWLDGRAAEPPVPSILQTLTPQDIINKEALTPIQKQGLNNALKAFIAGRSLRRMVTDFAEAKKDADEEDQPLKKEPPQKTPLQQIQERQTELWESWDFQIKSIDALFEAKGVEYLSPKRHWKPLSDALYQRYLKAKEYAGMEEPPKDKN